MEEESSLSFQRRRRQKVKSGFEASELVRGGRWVAEAIRSTASMPLGGKRDGCGGGGRKRKNVRRGGGKIAKCPAIPTKKLQDN